MRYRSAKGRQVLGAACLSGALAAAALLGQLASPASTRAACPNEAIREQQSSTMLSDCRAWEMVSTVDKGNYGVGNGTVLLSDDGERVTYEVDGGAPASSSGSAGRMLATRTASGWVSRNLLPPRSEMLGSAYFAVATTPDLSRWIAAAREGLGTAVPSESLLRLDDEGNQALLRTFPERFGGDGVKVVASEDLARIYALAPYQGDPSLPGNSGPGTSNVYDFGSGTPELVSRMPVTGLAPGCGVEPLDPFERGFPVSENATTATHWISTDGSVVFFGSRGDSAGCEGPIRLYRRDRATETTVPISGPPLPGDPELSYETFAQAAADGSWVIYSTPTSLEARDDEDGDDEDVDVYRWSAAGGNECLTCAVPNADVQPGIQRVAASEDGSHVYFLSRRVLADAPPGAPPGDEFRANLYVFSAGAVHFIGPTSERSGSIPGVVNKARRGGYITPNGNVLVFEADRPELNAITGSDNGGRLQVYRYDDRERDDPNRGLACVSCMPGGAPTPAAVQQELATSAWGVDPPLRVVTDDGSSVFFPTASPLVPEDVNGGTDLYEWHDGVLGLITDGVSEVAVDASGISPAEPQLNGVSADGRDVLFESDAMLTADARDSAIKEYDARVDGGFPVPPPPPPPCSDEACRGAPAAQPGPLAAGSGVFAGPGNARSAHKRHRRHRHRARHRHHRAAHKRGARR